MRFFTRLLGLFTVSIAVAHDQIPGAPQTVPIVIEGGTIHVIDGPDIENGQVLFENGKIIFFKDGSLKGRAELTKKQKTAFSKIVKSINMDHLPTLAIPSKKFMFDGSAFGQLKIVSAKKISSTPLFDVDSPPEEILELVRYLKNLAKGELT